MWSNNVITITEKNPKPHLLYPSSKAKSLFPLPLLFVSQEKVIFRQADWEPRGQAAACQVSYLKGHGQENEICVMQSIVDSKWYREVTTAPCSQVRPGNRPSGIVRGKGKHTLKDVSTD